ncbi:MAG TPA: hypothetical protein VGD98_23985 [Ktedonobacteraceae bacterium]
MLLQKNWIPLAHASSGLLGASGTSHLFFLVWLVSGLAAHQPHQKEQVRGAAQRLIKGVRQRYQIGDDS